MALLWYVSAVVVCLAEERKRTRGEEEEDTGWTVTLLKTNLSSPEWIEWCWIKFL